MGIEPETSDMPGKRATLHHQDIYDFSCIIVLQIHTSEHICMI